MKIAIYSPYLDTFGGGEKYMMTIAEILSEDNSVDVLMDKHLGGLTGEYLKNELSKRFNLNFKQVFFINAPLGKNTSIISRLSFFKKYDLLFYLTDGSIFYPTAKKNILHIQSPLMVRPAITLWGKAKLKGWDLIIYNSRFTQEHSQDNWPIRSEVVYPPVDVDKIKPKDKKRYILSVGRFFGFLKEKKHEVMINTFRNLYKDKNMNNWSLNLVGSAGKGDQYYLNELKRKAQGLPVNFYPNLSYYELIKLYGQASIYWHAAGFEEEEPARMEHFGIATVEAMAAGCVPVVIEKGGQKEIIEDGKSGFLWNNLKELEDFTIKLSGNNKLWECMSKQALVRADSFSKDKFKQKILSLTQI